MLALGAVVACTVFPSAVFSTDGLAYDSLPDGVGAIRVERIDGSILLGGWAGIEPDSGLRVQTGDKVEIVPLHDIASIGFERRVATHAADPDGVELDTDSAGTPIVLFLPGRGRLPGRLLRSGADSIVVTTVLGVERSFPFDRVAAMTFDGDVDEQAGPRFAVALARRLPGQDVLITRSSDGAKTIRGRLAELNAEDGSFEFGDKLRSFKINKMFGVVFAAGAVIATPEPVDCEMVGGARFSGRVRSADLDRLRMSTSVGFDADVDLSQVARLTFHSPRVSYVSDMVPLREETAGLVHTPSPVRKNRSVARKPLSIDGRVFDRGLGVHSRTALEYRLGGDFDAFAATIGIDDWVRPRGSVVFRLLDDKGDVLFDSGEVTGRDEGRDILVDVTGVERLVLLVDYGDGLDVSDHADWGGARLIRKASP